MSHLTQMAGLAVHNFVSAAAGAAVAVALIRGLTRRRTHTLGNFWVDLVRTTTRILLPLSFVFALVLVSQGVVQNFHAAKPVTTVAGQTQTLPGGPIASQEAIKEIGENGGGPYNANSSHPFENPNPITNMLQIWMLLAIPFAFPWMFGKMAGSLKQGSGGVERDARALARRVRVRDGLRSQRQLEAEQRRRHADRNVDAGRRQHGGQGDAVRVRDLRPVRIVDDRHVDGRRSTRSTTASRRSAARRRSSTSCSARSTPAAPAPASTACCCSRSCRCSSRA